jgi:hypothetical protein
MSDKTTNHTVIFERKTSEDLTTYIDPKTIKLLGFSFSEALNFIENGLYVSRKNWNGAYIWLLKASPIKAEWCKDEHLKKLALNNGGEIEALGSIRMLTTEGKILTGWVPSQEDMFTRDWFVVNVK